MGTPLLRSQLPILRLPLVRLGSGSADPVFISGSLASPSLGSSRVNEDKHKVKMGKVKTEVVFLLILPLRSAGRH